MNDDKNLDLLDLDDDATMDALPDAAPFVTPRPRKPWLLLGLGVVVIILATYIIVRTIGGDSASTIDVDLDVPAVVVDGNNSVDVKPAAPAQPAAQPVVTVNASPDAKNQPAPVANPAAPTAQPDAATPGVPVRVIEERRNVTFNPDKADAPKPVEAKQPSPAKKATAAKSAPKKTVTKQQVAPKGSWYVQFGSYSTRALAERAERQIRNAHSGLFAGRQFVILAAQLPNGTTTYRLRIAFSNANDANGFCRNAKSDGLDCYVAK